MTAPKSFEELKAIAESLGVEIPIKAPFTPNDINKLMPLFRLPLDEEAIQVSKGSDTKKGYDTTGYAYQSCVDRLNWVLGPTNWTWRILNEQLDDTGTTSTNRVKYAFSGEIELLIGYRELNPETKQWEWITVHNVPPIPTDHESTEKGSARKGMLTKGIKRSTSMIGVGADAYLGILDDDLVTGAAPEEEMTTPRKHQDRFIDSKEYIQLVELGKKKGLFVETKLREFYRTKSEGRITNDPANLTKAETKEVKSYLFQLPDYKEPESDPVKELETESENNVSVPEEKLEIPKSLAELLAADEATIRKIAAEYSFQMPAQLNDKNKGPLCKTLGHLMGLK